jgi:hypothetical protein
LPLLAVDGVAKSSHGNTIADLHWYADIGRGHVIAYIGCGKAILSVGQLKLYNNDVIDPSVKVLGGLQCVRFVTSSTDLQPELSSKAPLRYLLRTLPNGIMFAHPASNVAT